MIDFSASRVLSGRASAIQGLAGLACSGLLGVWITATPQSAWARPLLNDTSHFLLAQQVVDGLPPPPLGAAQEAGQQYLVVVNGDSQILLSQVQAVQPAASVQEYNGQRFIQAGLFANAASAQQQVNTLSAAGIGAQVVAVTSPGATAQTVQAVSQAPVVPYSVTVPALPPAEPLPTTALPATPSSVEFNSTPPALDAEPRSGSRSYYVVIPSRGKKLEDVSEQITRLTDGMGVEGMVTTATSRGSHVRVGPFNSRDAASRWTRYFRDFGMDARVSYSR